MYAIEERSAWSKKFDKGELTSYYLEEYRRNRDDPFWRSTRELEKLCEYAILLEKKVENLKDEIYELNYVLKST